MQRRMMLVLFFGVLMAALDVAIVGPALPAIQAAFQVSDRLLPWLFTIYVLTNLVGTPLMAKLSDRLGRRSAYLAAVGLFALGSLVVVLSPSFGVMLVGRAIQGFGAGGIFPVASAVIGDTFPADQRGRALGLIGAVWGLAFIIGPILGGLLLLLSWHWLFIINIPIALAVIAAGAAILPATRPAAPQVFDWRGMAALAVLLTSLAYGLNQIDAAHLGQSLASPGVWPFLALGLALIPLLAVVERRGDIRRRSALAAVARHEKPGVGHRGTQFGKLLRIGCPHHRADRPVAALARRGRGLPLDVIRHVAINRPAVGDQVLKHPPAGV